MPARICCVALALTLTAVLSAHAEITKGVMLIRGAEMS
jgi:hypothetical protein